VPEGTTSAGDQFVQSLARGLSVIRAFDHDHREMTLSEVAERVDLSRATTRRFLSTLVDLGYVRTDGRLFALTPQVLQLGAAYLSGLGLPRVARPHLERLSAQIGQSTSAAVLDGADIVFVARVAARRIISVDITVGSRFPAGATSMGRVLLAGLPEAELSLRLPDSDALSAELESVRRQGWAAVDQELEPGLLSIAVPVRDGDARTVAALGVSASTASSSLAELIDTCLPRLVETARLVGDDLALTGS